jgi:glycosyltransferase involved in cell wall biosynthesis
LEKLTMHTYLVGIGDPNDPLTWSGIPYHFLQAAHEVGLVDEGLPLLANGLLWTVRRAAWNTWHVLSGYRYGGYQYQQRFLDELFSGVREKVAGARLVNCFQLFPPSAVRNGGIEKWFYVDMTLRQLFALYGAAIDRRTASEAIEREMEGYQSATGVMTLSRWAAASVIHDYGVPPERVHPVTPGANLDADAYTRWAASAPHPLAVDRQSLRLVFVGKYWKRKGLDRLVDAFRLARMRGAKLTLRVIGIPRESVPIGLRGVEGVEWKGLLSKRTDAPAFLSAVAECDVGCLLSRADASPIALREYCALGLVTLYTDVGGAPEMVEPGASVRVPSSAGTEEVADLLLSLWRDPARFREMRAAAWGARDRALWRTTCSHMLEFWPSHGSGCPSKPPEGVLTPVSVVRGRDFASQ